MIQGTRSKQVGKFVFSWIKSKTVCATPNLIRDQEGNIIVDPNNAIKEINNQWDTVFAANVLHSDPMEVLKFAWPYIQESRQVASIPTLTGSDLRAQALRRKIDAAPGLDGWRTPEMKMLPVAVYDVAASYFQKVEQGVRQLPECLVLARQIILDKKGDAPLQKRLISLLPIFFCATHHFDFVNFNRGRCNNYHSSFSVASRQDECHSYKPSWDYQLMRLKLQVHILSE